MFLSSLAAVSFWLLAFLVVVGLYKLYNYVMVTFVGRVQDDVFEYEEKKNILNCLYTSEYLVQSFHPM